MSCEPEPLEDFALPLYAEIASHNMVFGFLEIAQKERPVHTQSRSWRLLTEM